MLTFVQKLIKRYTADECAADALVCDDGIDVQIGKKAITFVPKSKPKAGIIYYPGGRIQTQSFARMARCLAGAGYFVSLEIMPFGLAMLDIHRANKTRAKHRKITKWLIAGFSLGGVASTLHVKNHPKEYAGLILYGSYPTEKLDISDTKIKVLQIIGELDGFSPVAMAEDCRVYLPKDAELYIIEGGNHVQFAEYNGGQCYGKDNKATISRCEQQSVIADKTMEFAGKIC